MIPGSPEYLAELAAMQEADPGPMPGEQRSHEWMQSRLGNCTASRFKDVLDFTKAGKEGAKRAAYRLEVVIERITGVSASHYVSDEMQWGIEQEPHARMAYEALTGSMVLVPGYRRHPTIDKCGGSPDGLVDDEGMIEIKCPKTSTHIKTMLSGDIDDHQPQMQGYLWIEDRKWCDFISYDPRLPEGLQLYTRRVMRDEKIIATLECEVKCFLSQVAAQYEVLRTMAASHHVARPVVALVDRIETYAQI